MKTETFNNYYRQYKRLIYRLCLLFRRQYNLHPKRWLGENGVIESEANYLFTLAIQTWNPNRAKIGTWIYHRVWHGLIDWLRKHRRLFLAPLPKNGELLPDKTNGQTWDQLKECSVDAQKVSLLVAKQEWNHQFSDRKTHLYYQLRKEGWTNKRITDAFQEIEGIL